MGLKQLASKQHICWPYLLAAYLLSATLRKMCRFAFFLTALLIKWTAAGPHCCTGDGRPGLCDGECKASQWVSGKWQCVPKLKSQDALTKIQKAHPSNSIYHVSTANDISACCHKSPGKGGKFHI